MNMKPNRKYRIGIISWVVFIAYVLLMLWEVFIGPYRSSAGTRRYNLYPFKTILNFLISFYSYDFRVFFINIIANIAVFIPLGFFIPFLSRRFRRLNSAFMLYIIIIVSIEVIQYILNVGVFDIDDIILNISGCASGYLLFRMAVKKHDWIIC